VREVIAKLFDMDLKTYITDSERGTAKNLADALGVSRSFLSQMAAGTAPISPERAVLIEKETGGQVTRKDMYPDRWHLIWPELVNVA
jgi:DNA-binding transcriptional regulator YdaS (Cro superfamily)